MESTHDRLIRYLEDAWAVEKALVATLGDMAHEVEDPGLRSMLDEHCRATRQQEESLEARIRALGKEPSGGKGFWIRMMARITDALHGAHDENDRAAQDLVKTYGTEHFEMAMYHSLEAYASAIGDAETAQLASRHFEQERRAAETIWPLIAAAAARCAQVPGGATYGQAVEVEDVDEDEDAEMPSVAGSGYSTT
jgi:ferritin-like metal-binding protein YciE